MEGDGLAELVFHCVQEMDIDNRMLVSLGSSSFIDNFLDFVKAFCRGRGCSLYNRQMP